MTAMDAIDEIIAIEVAHFGAPLRCRLRLFAEPGSLPVAVVTELAENPGASITNAAESIWRALARRLDTSNFALVEHYGPESYADGPEGETFDLVTVREGVPNWFHLPAFSVEEAVLEAREGPAP